MQNSIRVLNVEIPLDFYPATVIHADKYSETQGGTFDTPVSSTLYTDIVVRIKDTNEDYPIYTRDVNLPVYTNQELTLISTGNGVIGYIDDKTNSYYYTTRNLSRKLGLGLSVYWALFIGVVCGVVVYLTEDYHSGGAILPLVVSFLLYKVQNWILNYKVRKAVDECLNF